MRVLGHVPDVRPWFESLRLTIAPLRYGAGTKGKVATSLAAGVPCVATPIAAEGMALADAGVIVADSAGDFAEAIRAAYNRSGSVAAFVAVGAGLCGEDAVGGRLEGTTRCHAAKGRGLSVFFFEKKNQKTSIRLGSVSHGTRNQVAKVFCFFFSKKKAFRALNPPTWRASIATGLAAWAATRLAFLLIGAYSFRLDGQPVPWLGMWIQWDSSFYLSIAEHGYLPPTVVTGLEDRPVEHQFLSCAAHPRCHAARVDTVPRRPPA